MAGLFFFNLSLAVFLLSGCFFLRLVRPPWMPLPARLAVCFVLGLGGVSLQMLLYSLASVPFGVLVIAAPWVVLYGITCLPALRPSGVRGAQKGPGGGLFEGTGWIGLVLLAIIFSQAAYAFVFTPLLPVRGWDSWLIWFFKARVFFIDGGVKSAFLQNPEYAYSHPDYPLMVPLAVAWVYVALGRAAEMWAKVLYPLQFVSMLLVFHWAARKVSGAPVALLFTALLSLTPVIVVHTAGFVAPIAPLAGGDYVGYADLTLSVCFLSAGAFLYLGVAEGEGPYVVLAAFFLALGAWTKNEGLPFALFGLALISLNVVIEKKGYKALFAAALIIAAFALPWSAWKDHLALGSEFVGRLNLHTFFASSGRLGRVVGTTLWFMFFQTGLFSFTWWVFAASTALNWRAFGQKPMLFLLALLAFQLLLYVFVFVVTPFDFNWHMRTSLDRLVMHMIPLCMLITAFNAGMILRRRGVAGSF